MLNDEMIANFTKMDHVLAATPFYQAYSLNGTITAGKGDRYSAYLGNAVGVYASAMEPMGFTLASGDWLSDTGSYGRDVIPIMVCEQTGYMSDFKYRGICPPRDQFSVSLSYLFLIHGVTSPGFGTRPPPVSALEETV